MLRVLYTIRYVAIVARQSHPVLAGVGIIIVSVDFAFRRARWRTSPDLARPTHSQETGLGHVWRGDILPPRRELAIHDVSLRHSCGCTRGKFHLEGRALSECRFDPNASAVHLDYLLGDCEPKTSATSGLGQRAVDLV